MNIVMLLDMAAQGYGDRIALSDSRHTLTYTQLRQRVIAGAAWIKQLGVERLIYIGSNGPAFCVALFAAAWADVPLLPINYRLSSEQISNMLARQPRSAAIAEGEGAAVARTHVASVISPSEWLEPAWGNTAEFEWDPVSEGIAVMLYTSGTTAEPKLALLRHRHLTSYILATVEFGAGEADEAMLVSVPPYHIAGIANVLSNIYAGRRLVPLESFTPAGWLATIREQNITHAMIVPTMLSRIVDDLDGQTSARVPSLRTLAYGGSRVSPLVIERAMRLFGDTDFVNAYGLTETSSTIAVLGPNDHRLALASDNPAVRARLQSAGLPMPGVEIQIRSADGSVLGPGEVGDIWVRGPQVSGEYVGQRASLDVQGWLATRDFGYLDADGYLFIGGRADDTIIRGGENIAPSEIEEIIARHPAVHEAAVVGVPDEEWGHSIAAVIVPRPGAQVSGEEIQAWVRMALRSSKTPQRVVFRSALPHTETGKLLRRQVLADLR